MKQDKGALQYKEDRQHLQDVSPMLAAQADLLLCVTECSEVVGFPVHKTILTAHSSVLGDAIESTLGNNIHGGLPRLPLDGDDVRAVRSALACMYHDFVLPRGVSSPKASMPDISLKHVPVHTSHMRFYDKYSMTIVAQTQLEALMKPLREYMQHGEITTEDAAAIIACASDAQGSNSVPLVAACESIIVRYFPSFASQYESMRSQLSTASLLSIARGLYKLQERTMSELRDCNFSMYARLLGDSSWIARKAVADVHEIPTDVLRLAE